MRRGCERDDDTGCLCPFSHWFSGQPCEVGTDRSPWRGGDSAEVTARPWQGLRYWMFFPKTHEALVWKSQHETGWTQVPF